MDLDKIKRKVNKQYPGAFLVKVRDGYTVVTDSENGVDTVDILSEYLLKHPATADEAWLAAQECSMLKQNLNRSHPLKAEVFSDMSRGYRVKRRLSKGRSRRAR